MVDLRYFAHNVIGKSKVLAFLCNISKLNLVDIFITMQSIFPNVRYANNYANKTYH